MSSMSLKSVFSLVLQLQKKYLMIQSRPITRMSVRYVNLRNKCNYVNFFSETSPELRP
jgi:hypothetical protein